MHNGALNSQRMLARLAQLSEVTSTPGRGVTRLAYSPEDARGRALVAQWMRDAGLSVQEDAATNVIGLRPGRTDRILMTGSHLDTVIEAGHLDGAYGVVAAIEAADWLQQNGTALEHTLAVVGFSNEEGARGTPGMTGSHALAGLLRPEWLEAPDHEGVTLAERISNTGGQPAGMLQPSLDLSLLDGFIELHIEQGPILESSGVPIGVVQAITGRDGIELHLHGVANHAGTTPMANRHDALVAAAHVVLGVEGLAHEGWVRVATVGVMEVGPGSSNVIPNRVALSIEVRDADDERIRAALAELTARIEATVELTGTSYTARRVPSAQAVASHQLLADCIADAARSLALGSMPIDSGAGHDAQVVAGVAPMAMIFVPSSEGVSHSSLEDTSPAHLSGGAQVLAAALLEADARITEPTPSAGAGAHD